MNLENFSAFLSILFILCEVCMLQHNVPNNGKVLNVAQRNASIFSKESVNIDMHGWVREQLHFLGGVPLCGFIYFL